MKMRQMDVCASPIPAAAVLGARPRVPCGDNRLNTLTQPLSLQWVVVLTWSSGVLDDRARGQREPVERAAGQPLPGAGLPDEVMRKPERHGADRVEAPQVLVTQLHIEGTEIVLKLGPRARPDDRQRALGCDPGDGELARGAARLRGNPFQRIEDGRLLRGVLGMEETTAHPRCRPISPLRYLPVNTPPPSGDQATVPRTKAAAMGSNSRSGVRSTRLYSSCTPASGTQPRHSASVAARATRQAGKSDRPAYRILPARTRSSNPRMMSSMGVIPSGTWTQ